MTQVQECKKHGLTTFVWRGTRWRCRKCAVDAVTKRRQKLKVLAIEYKGGQCSRCGYNKSVWALDFHHLNPNTKDFAISGSGVTRSWEKIKVELDKCDLVCKNCHAEIHQGEEA